MGLLLSLLVVLPAQAGTATLNGAKHHVETWGKNALASLGSSELTAAGREAALAAILQEGVAVDLIGRFVLGRHWNKATPQERAEYQPLFRALMIKTYARHLNSFAGTSFEIGQAVSVGEKDVLVTTHIDRPSGAPVELHWRVRLIDASYKIIDVVAEGVSLAATQRQEIGSVVGRRGVEGLLEMLKDKTGTLIAAR